MFANITATDYKSLQEASGFADLVTKRTSFAEQPKYKRKMGKKVSESYQTKL